MKGCLKPQAYMCHVENENAVVCPRMGDCIAT